MVFLRLSITAAIPVLCCVIFALLDKKTRFGGLKDKKKQIIIGIVFGCLAVLATEKGVTMDGYVINVRDASPVLAGLIFGPWAGVIAGLIGGIERWFAALWGAGMYTRIACSVSTAFAGIFGGFIHISMFNEQRPKWYNGMIAGLIAEVVHMTMVFLTNLNDAHHAFIVVKSVYIPMISVNTIAAALGTLFVWIIYNHGEKEERLASISTVFRKFMLVTIVIGFIACASFSLILQTNQARSDTLNLIATNISDVENDIADASDESLLYVTKFVSADLKSTGKYTSNAYLAKLAKEYGLAEIHVISPGGTIVASSDKKFVGFYMGSGEQSAAFMDVINGTIPYYVQDYQPMTFDKKTGRKYAALKDDKSWTIQVAYDGETVQREISIQAEGITKNRHIGANGNIIVADPDMYIISSPKGDFGRSLESTGISINTDEIAPNELFRTDCYGTDSFAIYAVSEGNYIIGTMDRSEALFNRNLTLMFTMFIEIIMFAVVYILIYFLIRKLVVDNMHFANRMLRKVSSGDLDVKLNPYPIVEFNDLATDLNVTVDTLKGFIAEAAARIDKDLRLAKDIQAGALPSVFPPFPNETAFEIYATMDTAKEVGGDFYDFFYIGERKFAFLVADVSGKGVPAAMFMMTAKTLLKSLAESGLSTDKIMVQANDELCAHNDAGMFVTCWLGIIDLNTGKVQCTNGGHNPPLIRHKGGDFEYLKTKVNLVLAGMEGMPYDANEFELKPGDEIYIYTDGVTEATDSNNELYGEDRLINILNQTKPAEAKDVCAEVKKDIDKFVGEADQFDDITMLSFKYKESFETLKIDEAVNKAARAEAKEGLDVNDVHEITIEATTENIPKVTAYVEDLLETYGCPFGVQTQIDIALDELLSNIAYYAYNPEVGPATIRVEVKEDPMQVAITFIDKGQPYDPLAKKDPNTMLPIEERETGGLGIFMVKQSMDDVVYDYKDGQNILTITKNFEK